QRHRPSNQARRAPPGAGRFGQLMCVRRPTALQRPPSEAEVADEEVSFVLPPKHHGLLAEPKYKSSATERTSPLASATSRSDDHVPCLLSLSILTRKSSVLATGSFAISTMTLPGDTRSETGQILSTPVMTAPLTASLIV